MEPDTPEEARVAENEGALRLMQDEVIVFVRLKPARLQSELSGHAEMDADPIIPGEFEEHLLSPRRGTHKTAAG